jgi:hypothetical protein
MAWDREPLRTTYPQETNGEETRMSLDQGENIAFLLCLPRSGSTVLSLILGNHSAIYCPPEPWFLLKLSTLANPGNLNSAFDDEWATRATAEFFHGEILDAAARAFASVSYSRNLDAVGKRIFVDKTPRYYHILSFIDRLFPKARKIWLKRNLLDVALSYRDSWGVDMGIITGQEVKAASFDFAVAPFSLARYFSGGDPTKLEVQYEDLVRSPEDTVSGICTFLGLPFEDKMLDYTSNQALLSQHRQSSVGDKIALGTNSVHSQSTGRWATDLPASDIRQLVDFLGLEIFHRMGYSDTIDALRRLGIQGCSETAAEEARQVVATALVDKARQLYDQVSTLRERLQVSNQELRNREQQLSAILSSPSWKLTAPLRWLQGLLVDARRRLNGARRSS